MARAYLTLHLMRTVMLFLLVTVCSAMTLVSLSYTHVNAFVQNVTSKEIDSKSDLLQEESMAYPAEHRAYPDMDMQHDMPNMLSKKNLPSKYEPSSNEVWPFTRSESSQIKVSRR